MSQGNKIYWKTNGIHWKPKKPVGKPMSTIGNKWNSWKTNESIGNPMKSMGNLMKSFGKFIASTGKPMKSIGKQRKSIGSPMQSIEKQWHPLGNPWNPLENKWNPNDMTSHYDMANLRIMACESRHVIPWWLMPLIFNQYAMRHGCWGQATPHCNFLWGGACMYTCPPPTKVGLSRGGPRKWPPPAEKLRRRAASLHNPCNLVFPLRNSRGIDEAN